MKRVRERLGVEEEDTVEKILLFDRPGQARSRWKRGRSWLRSSGRRELGGSEDWSEGAVHCRKK